MAHTQDEDRLVEEAKASMFARMEEIGRRVSDARHKLDIKAHIAAHPRAAFGIALGVGVLLGIPGGGKQRSAIPADQNDAKNGLIGALVATLGTLAFKMIKDVAMHQVAGAAKGWWDHRTDATSTEAQASTTRTTDGYGQQH
ncbi:MAG: hypothetical protein H0X17_01190 [Deltaproteobacteria bacterium]|nr:hypothetical protein [Deltaproteobacteria bacterium]